MENVIEWEGSGWYASRQVGQYESQRVETVLIPFDPQDWDEASDAAKSAGLGTPVYARRQSDLE